MALAVGPPRQVTAPGVAERDLRAIARSADEFRHIADRRSLSLDLPALGAQCRTLGLEVGEGRTLTLALARKLFPALALRLNCGERGYGPAALGGLLDGGVDLVEPPVEVGDGVGLDVDPGCKGRVLRLDRRCSRTTLAHVSRDELGVNAGRIDDGKAATSATSVRRHTQAVTRHRRASHPAVTSLAVSIANAIRTTANGAPGNSIAMPLIEKKAAALASTIAAVYAAMSMPAKGVTGAVRAPV